MPDIDSTTPLRGGRVIVADHHAHTRTTLREMVSVLGVTTILNSSSAAEVVRLVKARQVDVILCDYELDGMRDGQQLLEELRQDKLIPLATIFMMITGERTYKRVVSVAEFAPDDYLIKPFTSGQLLDRLSRVSLKKKVFADAYAMIESGRVDAALAECGRIRATHPQYTADALRLMVDMLMTLKRLDQAERLLREILEQKAVPWAAMGLANVHRAKKELAQAEAVLEDLCGKYPEYLGAHDLMAKVKEEMGQPQEALSVLETAGAISSSNVSRLRRSGDLATVVGDHEKASRLYARVIDRARNSSLARPEDFVCLANAYLEQGREQDAERVMTEQRRAMRGTPDAELVSSLMDFQRFGRPGPKHSPERAAAALDKVLQAHAEIADKITPALEFDIFNACCQDERWDQALAIGERLCQTADANPRIVERIEGELGRLRVEKARMAAIVPLNQVIAMAKRMLAKSWDEAMGHACKASLAHWVKVDPDAQFLPEAQARVAEVLRKYGIEVPESFAQ
jgi:CheY-like chemotaxis protein